ncbi:MAG: hypothetical protein QX195_04770 [Methylococcaceae bacterium]
MFSSLRYFVSIFLVCLFLSNAVLANETDDVAYFYFLTLKEFVKEMDDSKHSIYAKLYFNGVVQGILNNASQIGICLPNDKPVRETASAKIIANAVLKQWALIEKHRHAPDINIAEIENAPIQFVIESSMREMFPCEKNN